jgi:site-specific recombinase XerD
MKGKNVIFKSRTKSQVEFVVPILPQAQAIIDKYNAHPQRLAGDVVIPINTNQKCNAYLKEIQGLAGISKELTFHMARHTFATTVTLNNNVPIETVSKSLGHTKLATTQHYAKILPNKVINDFDILEKRMAKTNA